MRPSESKAGAEAIAPNWPTPEPLVPTTVQVRSGHVVHATQAVAVQNPDVSGWIDADALRVHERSSAVGAVTDPIGSVHIVDPNDPVIVDIRNVDPPGRIESNALRPVKLANA